MTAYIRSIFFWDLAALGGCRSTQSSTIVEGRFHTSTLLSHLNCPQIFAPSRQGTPEGQTELMCSWSVYTPVFPSLDWHNIRPTGANQYSSVEWMNKKYDIKVFTGLFKKRCLLSIVYGLSPVLCAGAVMRIHKIWLVPSKTPILNRVSKKSKSWHRRKWVHTWH